jgi:hypothetical protein
MKLACPHDTSFSAPSPLEGEGWGGGYSEFLRMQRSQFACRVTPPSRRSRMASAIVDLPLKGRGERKRDELAAMGIALEDTKDGTTTLRSVR